MPGLDVATYNDDMQTIHDYAQAIVDKLPKIEQAYINALANVETTFQSASPQDAKPDIVGAMLKSGLKSIEKSAAAVISAETDADVGPLVEMVNAISEEIDRAAKAAGSLTAGNWIKQLRAKITNAFTNSPSADDLRQQIEKQYNQHDQGGRDNFIADVQEDRDALNQAPVPPVEAIELSMYESWISQAFNNDCIDGTGVLVIQFDGDGTLTSATVNAPLGDKIAGAINGILIAAGASRLMDLPVVKKVCRGDVCMCFEADNTVRKATDDSGAQAFLTSQDAWNRATQFTT